jgi:hypothetical protein
MNISRPSLARWALLCFISVAGYSLPELAFAGDATGSTNREPHFFSKFPWAVDFGMEGTVTNVTLIDERIHFQLNGRFWFSQYPPESAKQVVIEVHRKTDFSATVTPDSFVAVTADGRAGSVQNDKGKLLKILTAAAGHGTVVKFALTQPKMDFGGDGFTLLDAKVWRITDADLR